MKREQIEKKSVVTVRHDGLSFNVITAEVLHRAKYVRVLLNAVTGQLAVQATTEAGLYSARFYREEVFKSNRIKINSRSMIKEIRKAAGWSDGGSRNIDGVYFAEEDAIIYELLSAYIPSTRGGRACKR